MALDHEIVAYEIVVVAFAFVVVVAVVAWSLYVLVLASWDLAFQDEVDLRVVVVVALQNAVVVLEVVLEAVLKTYKKLCKTLPKFFL